VSKEQEDLTEEKERVDHLEDLEQRVLTVQRENVVLRVQTDKLGDLVVEVA